MATVRYNEQKAKTSPSYCTVCGELECLCRPRFSPGQLLTDDDLNRLNRYILNKQRLHNRHLYGWGVVCGLELRCDPCDDNVLVTSGYALSPCGDDIVVCRDDRVDVCKLIQDCLDQERKIQPCEPPRYGVSDDCEDQEEDWLLTVRYEEHSSRGITALRNATAQARCQPCDAVTFGGCDCDDGGKTKSRSYTTSLRPQPAQCEPTVVCEGYRYEVCRLPASEPVDKKTYGAMEQRFDKCMRPFNSFVSFFAKRLEGYENLTAQQLHALCCDVKGALIDLLTSHAGHDCTLVARARRLVCPDPQSAADDYRKELGKLLPVMAVLWYSGVRDCVCTALLPPCGTSQDTRVVLGQVTVRKGDCKVLRVCNWITERKFASTFPNLQYWLSWLPDMISWLPDLNKLRSRLEQLCCGLPEWPTGQAQEGVQATEGEDVFSAPFAQRVGASARATAADKRAADFTRVAAGILSGTVRELDPQALFMGMAGLKDEQGEPYLSDLERENLLPTLLMRQLGSGMIRAAASAGVPPFAELAAGLAGVTAGPGAEEIDNLKSEVAQMKETIERQKERIDELAKRVDEKE